MKCPKCGETKRINQFRMLTGPIWCESCGYRIEHKESDHSFFLDEREITEKDDPSFMFPTYPDNLDISDASELY